VTSAPAKNIMEKEKMEKIAKDKFAFFVLRPKKKKLTNQQLKVKQLSEISRVCLRKEVSSDDLYKCAAKEATTQLTAL
jgi:hypothetical protein